MKFIEILGFPGSGKSTFREKINKKELIFSLEYIFYQTLFSENKNISLLHYKFLYYFDKKKFYDIAFDNYLYKKNNLANIIKKKINHSNNDFYKNNINLYNNYKKLLNFSSYPNIRKKRILKRFIYFTGLYNFVKKKKKFKKYKILQDEGFYQKVFINYNIENKLVYLCIKRYFKSIPKGVKVLFVDEKIDVCIDRLAKRQKYFNYKNIELEKKIYIRIKKMLNFVSKKSFVVFVTKQAKNLKQIQKLINKL